MKAVAYKGQGVYSSELPMRLSLTYAQCAPIQIKANAISLRSAK
jgi:hypothetical protein